MEFLWEGGGVSCEVALAVLDLGVKVHGGDVCLGCLGSGSLSCKWWREGDRGKERGEREGRKGRRNVEQCKRTGTHNLCFRVVGQERGQT